MSAGLPESSRIAIQIAANTGDNIAIRIAADNRSAAAKKLVLLLSFMRDNG
jgi:hypothetical protein